MLGASTVAVICRKVVGVLNPAGTPTWIVLWPAPAGSNSAVAVAWFGPKVSGDATMTPTLGVPDVTGTCTLTPPRTGWLFAQFNVVGFRRAEAIWMLVFAANVLVEKFPGLLMM